MVGGRYNVAISTRNALPVSPAAADNERAAGYNRGWDRCVGPFRARCSSVLLAELRASAARSADPPSSRRSTCSLPQNEAKRSLLSRDVTSVLRSPCFNPHRMHGYTRQLNISVAIATIRADFTEALERRHRCRTGGTIGRKTPARHNSGNWKPALSNGRLRKCAAIPAGRD